MIFVSYDFCLYHRGDFCPLFWRGSCEESIYNYIKEDDKKLFRVGAKVNIIYARDELKRSGANGEKIYLDIVLEMAVSLAPVE